MKAFLSLFIPILFCLLIGFVAAYLEIDAVKNWYYTTLNTPPLIKNNFIFPLGWSLMHILIGSSIGLIIYHGSPNDLYLIKLFIAMILTKLLWSVTFFYMQNPLLGFINILVLCIIAILYAITCYSSKKLSFYLFIPYIIWIFFITYINGYVLIYN